MVHGKLKSMEYKEEKNLGTTRSQRRSQSKTLKLIRNVSCYVTDETIQRNLKISTVKEEISKFNNRYNASFTKHSDRLVTLLLNEFD
jgi:hypothetical protein